MKSIIALFIVTALLSCSSQISIAFKEQYGEENMKVFERIDSKKSPYFEKIIGSYNLKAVKINGETRNQPSDTTGYWLELLEDGRMIEWHSNQGMFCNCEQGYWKLNGKELMLRYQRKIDYECGNKPEGKHEPLEKEFIGIWPLDFVDSMGIYIKTGNKVQMHFPRGGIKEGTYTAPCRGET